MAGWLAGWLLWWRSTAWLLSAVHHLATPLKRTPIPVCPSCVFRTKQEAALRSTHSQREALDRRLSEQERGIQARLDAVEAALQVCGCCGCFGTREW